MYSRIKTIKSNTPKAKQRGSICMYQKDLYRVSQMHTQRRGKAVKKEGKKEVHQLMFIDVSSSYLHFMIRCLKNQ